MHTLGYTPSYTNAHPPSTPISSSHPPFPRYQVPISEAISNDIGVGGVLSLLWFRRRLPNWATKFIEMVLMVSADHGPAVSGNNNNAESTYTIIPLVPYPSTSHSSVD